MIMDELIDILDSQGNYTGKVELKSHAHRMGLFHATVHIWFYTKNGLILIQQRGKNKDTHPLLWDVSVAGHIGAGEEIEISAVREIEEEIGLIIPVDSLQKIGVFKSIQTHHTTLIDCEFHHTFIAELKVSLKQLQKQASEVEQLKLIPIDEFKLGIKQPTKYKYVPHNQAYYHTIYNELVKKLEAS